MKLKDPHIISWIIFVIIVLLAIILFKYIKPYFLKIALVGLLFILFHFADSIMFSVVGKNVKSFLSNGKFVKRWLAFPIFLLEIVVIYFLAGGLENFLTRYLSLDALKWWMVLIWLGIMWLFYWYRGSKE